jgi:hypothetical protein
MTNLYAAVADVVVPVVFTPYVVQRTAELTAFYDSGIINMDPEFAVLAGKGSSTVHMPFWNDLATGSQVLSDQVPLQTKKIQSDQDQAAIHNRGDSWMVNDLAKYLSGDDPLGEIGDLVANYWARDMEAMTIATVNGVFNSASMATSQSDISTQGAMTADNYLLGPAFIDAKQLLGDNKKKLVAIAMHSATVAQLLKADLIDFRPQSEGEEDLQYFQGLRIIEDDNCTVDDTGANAVFSTYLFGEGAIAMGVDPTDEPVEGGIGTFQVEWAREALSHNSIMINRRRFILHPRGVKWLGTTQAGISPDNGELQIGTNWQRVYQTKNVRLIRIKHNVAGM